jgi:hypothetical protein
MKSKSILLPACAALLLAALPSPADSVSGTETKNFGDFVSSSWRSDDFKGSSSREWDASGSSFRFTWQTESGDQIGRIGATFGSKLLGATIDNMPANCVMSANATFTPGNDHWFYWSIYGWTNPVYTYWGNTPKGWNTEFYIICHTDQPKSAFDADKKLVPIGSVDVDGATFDCYHTPRDFQAQWWAVRRPKTWTPSVNVKKIFDFWRSKGLPNESVVDIGWAVEAFPTTAGSLQLHDVHIPNLNPGSPAAASPPAPAH